MTFADMDYMRKLHKEEETKPLTKTQQLFNDYNPYRNICQGTQNRVLFICSAGLLRSPTAAAMGVIEGLNTRSCGSSSMALIPLSDRLIQWADKIVFMNQENYLESKIRVNNIYGEEVKDYMDKISVVWAIEDEYNYMEDGLQYVLKTQIQELKKELE